MDNWRTTYDNNADKEEDLLTKVLLFDEKRRRCVRKVLMNMHGVSYICATPRIVSMFRELLCAVKEILKMSLCLLYEMLSVKLLVLISIQNFHGCRSTWFLSTCLLIVGFCELLRLVYLAV